MKHTKNILKSLLITVMALSLLAVSCKKDEGGSKPTDPTPSTTKIVGTTIETAIKNLSSVTVSEATINFSSVSLLETIDLTVTKGTSYLSLATFKTGMKTELEKIKVEGATVIVENAGGNAASGGKVPVTFVVTIEAKENYELDAGIKGYQQADKIVKLTFSFTPDNSWAA